MRRVRHQWVDVVGPAGSRRVPWPRSTIGTTNGEEIAVYPAGIGGRNIGKAGRTLETIVRPVPGPMPDGQLDQNMKIPQNAIISPGFDATRTLLLRACERHVILYNAPKRVTTVSYNADAQTLWPVSCPSPDKPRTVLLIQQTRRNLILTSNPLSFHLFYLHSFSFAMLSSDEESLLELGDGEGEHTSVRLPWIIANHLS